MKFSRHLLILMGLLAAGSAGLALRARPKQAVVVTPVSMRVTETIAVSGRLRGETETAVGAPTSGRVAALFVREGDRVQANQQIARMDSDVLAAQLAQAESSLDTARRQRLEADAAAQTTRAQWAQAARPSLASDVARLRADTEQSVGAGKAKLAAARLRQTSLYQRYLEIKNGARPEEIEQAQTAASQAETNLRQLERDRDRQQALYKQNVIARVESERAETNYQIGVQTLDSARSKLRQLQRGNRAEQIAQSEADYLAAQEDVIAAEAGLRGARNSGAAQMQSLLSAPRPEDVTVAKRRWQEAQRARDVAGQRVAEAQAALRLAQRRRAESNILAPFAGTITQIVTEVGAAPGQNAPIVRLVRTGRPEIRVDLDEVNLGRLRIGQEALVTNDAFPDSRFRAKVTAIGAQVDADRGTVEARLTPLSPPDWIRPGQTFTVNILLGGAKTELLVPADAVRTSGGVASVLAVENGKIVKKSVKAAPMTARGVPILQGVSSQTQIVIEPNGFAEGETVRLRNAR